MVYRLLFPGKEDREVYSVDSAPCYFRTRPSLPVSHISRSQSIPSVSPLHSPTTPITYMRQWVFMTETPVGAPCGLLEFLSSLGMVSLLDVIFGNVRRELQDREDNSLTRKMIVCGQELEGAPAFRSTLSFPSTMEQRERDEVDQRTVNGRARGRG